MISDFDIRNKFKNFVPQIGPTGNRTWDFESEPLYLQSEVITSYELKF